MVVVRSGMVDLVGEVLVVVRMAAGVAVEVALAVLAHYLTSDQTIRVPSLLVDPAADDILTKEEHLTTEEPEELPYFSFSRAKSL